MRMVGSHYGFFTQGLVRCVKMLESVQRTMEITAVLLHSIMDMFKTALPPYTGPSKT